MDLLHSGLSRCHDGVGGQREALLAPRGDDQEVLSKGHGVKGSGVGQWSIREAT
jgi:hypothetical protein